MVREEGPEKARMPKIDRARILSGARALRACALLAAVAVPALQDEEGDTVYLKDGKREVGTVTEEDYAGAVLQPAKGAKKVLPWETVQNIEYLNTPGELSGGVSALNAGRFEDALSQLEGIGAEEKPRPVIRQQIQFYSAYAAQRAGKSDEALAAYTKLLEDFPKGRFLRSAADNVLALSLQKKDYAGAASALDTLAGRAKELPAFLAEISILRGRLLEAQG